MSDQRIIELSQRNTLADNDFLVTDSQAGGTAKVPGSLFNNEFAAMQNILGAKNLLPNNAVSKAEAGVVYTVNSDGTITATAESASTAISGISFGAENHVLKAGSYILSGMPANTSNGYIQLTFKDGTSGVTNTGGDTAFTLAHDERIAANAGFVIPSGATPNNVVCSPMIRPAGIRDNTYVPYAKTNKVLTDDVATLNTQLSDLNASKVSFSAMGTDNTYSGEASTIKNAIHMLNTNRNTFPQAKVFATTFQSGGVHTIIGKFYESQYNYGNFIMLTLNGEVVSLKYYDGNWSYKYVSGADGYTAFNPT